MADKGKKTRLLRKQPPMRQVLFATVPCVAGSVYFFGWRALATVVFCCAVGLAVEYWFCRRRKEPVSEAVLVTGVLFALIMPPLTAWHVLAVGMVFAVMFTKEVFGGFGRNFFNPALAGRCFVYICFPVALTATWSASAPLEGLGALTKWTTATGPDAITSATPMAMMKAGAEPPPLEALFFGGLPGTMGVTSALLILIGGLYLFVTGTAWRPIILSVIITYAVLNQGLHWLGVEPVPGALPALLGGGFLFGAFFMATDPISAPRTNEARVIYGIIIALCTVVIRNFSIFNGGLMFSILLGNMFGPIIDYGVNAWKARKSGAAEAGS
jgi:Na+-transporting NADH:ubiquinone oxidoreductase subunit B